MEPKTTVLYPIPQKLDVDDIRAVFDLWLSYQASKGWTRSDMQREAILLTWAHHGPVAFREVLLASISNGWKNLYAPPIRIEQTQPRGSVKPETPRHTLGIQNPGKGQVFQLHGSSSTVLKFDRRKK